MRTLLYPSGCRPVIWTKSVLALASQRAAPAGSPARRAAAIWSTATSQAVARSRWGATG